MVKNSHPAKYGGFHLFEIIEYFQKKDWQRNCVDN